eukprot:TRINITY_DN22896_c0_g1_i1.p1 TRINITY_DN22896_c0_g1~~TRINITY_DN22896_c0_g1_i1.p1  ORF type:complete len:462 (+),score=121.77 TRINITY_DN22896_c0_g1_i1:180-1565(+)
MGGKLLRSLDLYSKIPTDLTEATPQGALFSICAGIFMLLLFHIELYAFLVSPLETEVVMDRPEQMMEITFNVSMLDLPCDFAAVDVLDVLGTNRVNVTKSIDKWHLSEEGVKGAYQGRNVVADDIIMFDEQHVDLDELHADGVHAIPLGQENFLMWLEEHEYTFVDFYAPWCVWCNRLAPTWEALAEEMERLDGPVTVVQVDCDESLDLCAESKIQAFPTMRLFHRMEAISDYSGDRTVEAFSDYLNKHSDYKVAAARNSGKAIKLTAVHDAQWPGCIIAGSLWVNRVPGNFHIEAKTEHHNFNAAMTNLSHVVNTFRVGTAPTPFYERQLAKLPDVHTQLAPLDDQAFVVKGYHQAPHHYIKVVGTEYAMIRNRPPYYGYQLIAFNQVMHYDEESVPEAKFSYDLSPMAVKVVKKRRRWYSFITHALALVGGTFSIIGVVDACFWKATAKRRGSRPTIVR